MIKIIKASNNNVAVTLYEKTTIAVSLVHYLWVFTNASTNQSTTCIAEDTSDYINRYNLFNIVENNDPDPLSGEVSLDEGMYDYYVYEQVSSTNLDPTGLTLVESGLVTVYQAPTTDTIYESTSPQYAIYEQGK